jgi:hypothetical protein
MILQHIDPHLIPPDRARSVIIAQERKVRELVLSQQLLHSEI